jgi:transcriptional accessory protein Tex/SPT6
MFYLHKVILVKDDLVNIFKGSTRAKAMFPDLQAGGAAAVCLARFVQEPLAEYCNMWTSTNTTEVFGFESLYLDLHPLKVNFFFFFFIVITFNCFYYYCY